MHYNAIVLLVLLLPLSRVVDCQQHAFLSQQPVIKNTFLLETNYRIRVKQPISCEKSIQYSGYIDNLDTKEHVYFLFAPSRYSSKTDPIILTLNGQLGCSTMAYNWLETGSCLVKTNQTTEANPYSLNNVANMLYLDQSSDVGFSWTTNKSVAEHTLNQMADSLYSIIQVFFLEFSDYIKNDLHISSNSYASHLVPALAIRIVRENRLRATQKPIQLKSIIIGNGHIYPHLQQMSYADYSCDNNQIYTVQTCQKMKNQRRRCESLLNSCEKSSKGASMMCSTAHLYCKRALLDPFKNTKLNPFDIRLRCIHYQNEEDCYNPIMRDIALYANLQSTRTDLGIDLDAGTFYSCKKSQSGGADFFENVSDDIERLLANNVKILVYSGDQNWYNNWVGQLSWLSRLDWPGQVQFNEAKDKEWISYVSGYKAGTIKSHLNLSFVRVFNAGLHTFYDQPANMIDLYSRWLFEMDIGKE